VKVLLDTHALIWSVDDPARLSVTAVTALKDPTNDRLVSAATIWELAIKFGMGKITLLISAMD
jgi:PIN domain nuclease of toxin-antitoxin system